MNTPPIIEPTRKKDDIGLVDQALRMAIKNASMVATVYGGHIDKSNLVNDSKTDTAIFMLAMSVECIAKAMRVMNDQKGEQ